MSTIHHELEGRIVITWGPAGLGVTAWESRPGNLQSYHRHRESIVAAIDLVLQDRAAIQKPNDYADAVGIDTTAPKAHQERKST